MKTTTGTITATGSGSAVSHELNPSGPDTQAVVGVSGTFTSATIVVEGKLAGGSIWYPLLMKDRSTGRRANGSAGPSDSTSTSWRVDAEGLAHIRAYVSAGTPTDVDVEIVSGESEEFGGGAPDLTLAHSALTTFGAGITFDGATGANDVTIPDNLADAFTIQEGSTAYLTIVTTDSAERILLKKQTRTADSVKLAFGDGDDITVAWDGTDLDVLQAATNSSIKWGIDGAGIDQVWYGDTASTNMTWDQSADSLIFTGTAYISGNKKVAAAKTTDYTITAADSGKVLTTRGASGAVIFTLPTVAAGFTGVDVTIFNCVDQDMTVSAQTAGQIMFKHDAAANSLAYSTANEKIGGAFRCYCDGTSWLVMPLAEEAQTITVVT